jgi:hypothetical protein
LELGAALAYAGLRRPAPAFGFLVPRAGGYLVAWSGDPVRGEFQTKPYSDLKAALRFAHERLRLEAGPNPLDESDLERVWLRERGDSAVLYFKPLRSRQLQELRFARFADAAYVSDAFRRGDYASSPFGNALFLRPAR